MSPLMIGLAAACGAVAFGVWTKRQSAKKRESRSETTAPPLPAQQGPEIDDDQAADLIRRALPELERARREP